MKRITKISSMLFLLLMVAWSSITAGNVSVPFTKDQALTANQITAGKEIALWALNSSVNDRWFYRSDNVTNRRTATFSSATTFIVEDADNASGIVLKRKSDGKYMQKNSGIQWSDSKADAVVLTVSHPGESFSYTDQYLNPAPSWDPNYQTYLVRFTEAGTANILNGNDESGFATGTGSWSAFLVKDVNVIAYPFTFSDAPSNGQFAPNTHWYYLKLNEKYATCQEGNDYISLSQNNPISYGSFWAFVQNTNGNIEIYNAYTGTSKVLASVQPTTDNCTTIQPSLVDKNGLGDKIAEWEYSSENDGAFFLNLTQNSSCVLNDADNKGIIAFWKDKDAGSKLKVEPVDIESAITSVKENQNAISGAVGTLVTESYNEFNAALEGATTIESLVEALKIRDLTGQKVQISDNGYYRILGAVEKQYIYTSDGNLNTKVEQTGADQIIKFESTGEENTYNLKLQGKYIAKTTANNNLNLHFALTEDENEKGNFQIVEAGTGIGKFRINNTNSEANPTYVWKEYSKVVGWSGTGNGSQWYIIPATTIDVNITAAGYATVNYPFAVQVPSEVTAYTGTAEATEGVFTLKEIKGGIVPANTPVVLSGAEGTYSLSILANNTDAALESGLEGTLLSETIEGTTNAYILANGNNGVGFYQMSDNDRTMGANKAYLELPAEVSNVRSIIFSDGQTTGIENTVAEGAETEEYYDLQGRRIMNPTKGIFVTKSGKKVLINK